MILQICSIYDSKAEAWITPMFFQSNAQAIRSFGDVVNNPDSEFGKHPEDYTLFNVGSFNPANGVLVAAAAPAALEKGVNCVRQ